MHEYSVVNSINLPYSMDMKKKKKEYANCPTLYLKANISLV